ncbi:dihydrolipoyl dehydrogenase family protein [Furfurilactobacillus entadae]|uniref:dihydrolipoyl dehydrogenase family protein n=1 Tax=Furfurilactobacillus entadae TaxID=2922307 RepID=UPI0035ED4D39
MTEEVFDFDVLYVGSGHGTFDGAIPLASRGKRIGVIEAGLVGGTCPNRGCNAKITLDAPVDLTRYRERMGDIVNGDLTINWAANMAHKHAVIDGLPDMITGLLNQAGVTLITGRGVVTGPHQVRVDEQTYTAEKIVVATGLTPHRVAVPGANLAHTSDDFLELTELPKHIVILGGGYIGMEFATIANAAGSDVTVLLHGHQALRAFHQPFVEQVVADLKQRGVTFVTDAKVSALTQAGTEIAVRYGDGDTLTTDWVLDATGRIPNVAGLGLEDVGVVTNANGIVVNDHLQTNIPSIYASGDVIDKQQPKLTPTAVFESLYLMHQFAGDSDAAITYPVIPSVVFTSPQIVRAGVSPETAADHDGMQVHENHLPKSWFRQVDSETMGDNVLVYDETHHIIGATEMSAHAAEAINTLLPAIEFHFGPEELARLVYLFPTLASDTWAAI